MRRAKSVNADSLKGNLPSAAILSRDRGWFGFQRLVSRELGIEN